MINNIILVAFGGALGSVLRFLISELLTNFSKGLIFPLSTFVINVFGSFLLGIFHFIFINYLINFSLELRLFIAVGVLGGFTTFSTLSLDILRLIHSGHYILGLSYALLSLILSIAAIFLGYYISSIINY